MELLLIAVVSIGLGFLAGWLIVSSRLKGELSEKESRFYSQERELTEAKTTLNVQEKQLAEVKSGFSELQTEATQLRSDKTRLETLLKEASEQTSEMQLANEKALKAMLKELQETSGKTFEEKEKALNKSITDLLNPLTKMIADNDKKVEALQKENIQESSSLKKEIQMLAGQTKNLYEAENRLVATLSNSKGRGDWGELQLQRLLDMSGLISGVNYETQQIEGGLRPDVQVYLPNDRILYIDAKTVFHHLNKMTETEEEEVENRKKHAQSLEKEVLSLSSKKYEKLVEQSIDFVVLFVPRESMLRAALEEKPTLIEDAMKNKVILASPLVLMPILKVVAQSWEQVQISKNAQEIQELGKELQTRATRFLERYLKVEDQITRLSNEFEGSKKALTGQKGMLPQLKKMEDLGCKADKTNPSDVMPIEEYDALETEDESIEALLETEETEEEGAAKLA